MKYQNIGLILPEIVSGVARAIAMRQALNYLLGALILASSLACSDANPSCSEGSCGQGASSGKPSVDAGIPDSGTPHPVLDGGELSDGGIIDEHPLPSCSDTSTGASVGMSSELPALGQLPANHELFIDGASAISWSYAEDEAPEPCQGNLLKLPWARARISVYVWYADSNEAIRVDYDVDSDFPLYQGGHGDAVLPSSAIGWASKVISYEAGLNVDAGWQHTEQALGVAEGNSFNILSLGEGGSVTLSFEPPISNGNGNDFAVFENGFIDTYLEIGRVSVSSDGINFVPFDVSYLGETPVSAFGAHSGRDILGFAGRYQQGLGTGFDLQQLAHLRAVRDGQLDLSSIVYVRIDDVIGDGRTIDRLGNKIYDPYPGSASAGFDLDAIAVLNQQAIQP